MFDQAPRYNRRKVIAAALSVGPVALVGCGGGAVGGTANLQTRLANDIALIKLPTQDAKLTLISLDNHASRAGDSLLAQVRMDWAPGLRKRALSASAPSLEDAYAKIFKLIEAEFAHA